MQRVIVQEMMYGCVAALLVCVCVLKGKTSLCFLEIRGIVEITEAPGSRADRNKTSREQR